MNQQTIYDCILIGGGISGSALAYELAKNKLKVLLLEKDNSINSATSLSYGGLPYWAGTNSEISSILTEGINIYRNLSDELDQNIEFQELDLLLTIDNGEDPQKVARQYNQCFHIPELLDIQSACQLEPLLNPQSISGALRASHAHVNPIRVSIAYQNSFKKIAGKIIYEEVTGFLHRENEIEGVVTKSNKYFGSHIIVCAGGLSRSLLESIGIKTEVYFTNDVVLKVSAQNNIRLNTMLMPATIKRFSLESRMSKEDSSWQQIGPEILESIIDIGAVKFQDGSLHLGQISHVITDPHTKFDLNWSQKQIKSGIDRILPSLMDVPFTTHSCLVAFSKDPNRPWMGKVPHWSGIYSFGGFSAGILVAPVLARRFASAIIDNSIDYLS